MSYAGQRVLSVCTGSGLSCPEVKDLPAKSLNGTNGKEAEAKASHWKKLATELRPDQKRASGQGLGPFPFLSSRRTAGLGLDWTRLEC
jgi:hypothetical protein